jgi:hypothetical protein
VSGMSKARRWRLLWRAKRYSEKTWKATSGHQRIIPGYRNRAVNRMRAAYPDWPYNSNGNVRGYLL